MQWGYGRTEPGKLKGHLSNDRVETMRLSGRHTGRWKKDGKKSGSCSFRPKQDPPQEAKTERWRKKK